MVMDDAFRQITSSIRIDLRCESLSILLPPQMRWPTQVTIRKSLRVRMLLYLHWNRKPIADG